jgi:AraC family transcriptional regulator, transcriptional activator of pobA
MKIQGKSGESITIVNINDDNKHLIQENISDSLTLLWFTSDDNLLAIDGIDYSLNADQIVFLTEFHLLAVKQVNGVRLIRFNRPFYCVIDHDSEVSCKGILFFGGSGVPVLKLTENELKVFETVYSMFMLEMETKDNLQLEMLQMMLKRLLILCTRIYKSQHQYHKLDYQQTDMVREFNYLVEIYFRTKSTVKEYAQLLNKSPKTIANTFARLSDKTPLQFIRERRMLEAKRLLNYTDKQVSEIAYEIGFEDVQAFSRGFRHETGYSPTAFRNSLQGTIAN